MIGAFRRHYIIHRQNHIRLRKDNLMSADPQFTTGQKRFYTIVSVTFLISSIVLYGIGINHRSSTIQGISLTMPLMPIVWGIAFFHKERRFHWRWRIASATAMVLA